MSVELKVLSFWLDPAVREDMEAVRGNGETDEAFAWSALRVYTDLRCRFGDRTDELLLALLVSAPMTGQDSGPISS